MRESVPSGVRMPLLRAAFVGASVVWALMLPLVPFLAARPHASVFGTATIFALYSIGHLICHQLPERSFHVWGAQLPVCARCTGIYVGAAVAAVLAAAPLKGCPTRRPTYVGHPFRDAVAVRTVLAVAALPTAFTLVYEWTTGQTPGNVIRFAAGLPIGVAVAWLVVHATRDGATAENQVN
jgi:uncharacterized membrane protein